jgi:polyhydroxybutyrate depolymerase
MGTVLKKIHTLKRPTLQSIYIHHIIWGTVCLVLFSLLIGLWFNSQSLNQKTVALEQRLAFMTDPTCTARDVWSPGTTKVLNVEANDTTRSFRVHLPDNFDKHHYYPALLFFPGKGASALGAEQAGGLNNFPAITVYPEATMGKDNLYSWQGAPYSSGVNDVQFVSSILDKIEGQLCIQRSHIYAVGMSNGGGMVSLLSCQLSDRFAAYGIVGGAMYYPVGKCAPPKPTPLINIHGDSDITVPYFGSLQRQLPPIDSWVAARAKDNGCSSIPDVTTDTLVTISQWKHCKNNATVKNIRMHNGGHTWAPDAPALLWQFMSAYSL